MGMRDRIRQRLDALGLSPRAASIAAGLNTHYLQKVLADPDKSITTDNLLKLAKALDCKPEWLLTGTGIQEADATSEIVDLWGRLIEEDQKDVLDFARWKASNSDT